MSQNTLLKRKKSLNLGQYSFVLIFAALFLIYFFVNFKDGQSQLKWTGVTNILRHSAIVGLLSYGMAMIIITGDIDLSIGAILGCVSSFGCVIANMMLNNGAPTGVGVLVTVLFCLVAGTLLGFLNGILIGKVKLPAFIVTLATQLIFRSVAQYSSRILDPMLKGGSSNTYRVSNGAIRDAMYGFGNGQILKDSLALPITGLIFLAVGILLIYVTTSTKYGKRLFAIGSNTKAAHMAGINVEWTRVSVFTIAGLLCGVGATLWICQQGGVDPATTGVNNEMFGIAATVLGGIAMSGGKGKLVGVIFGAMSYTLIDKIIAALNVDSLINNSIKGLILLIAIVIQILGPQIKNVVAAKKAK